ncbi:MAG: EutN/CcmL family microcompartment protein [Planctomycetaceae bacterium]|nr:EutN/CcmL family microcompartment protein [Planctomycetaceae bacterium]
MRVGEVIGNVTLSQCHPMVSGGTWLVVVPLTYTGLKNDPAGREEPIVVYDELGASPGALIGMSEGAEAGAPFHPDPKPLDAYNACILDTLEID